MKRSSFYLTSRQMEKLHRISKETGLSVAEIIRRAIDKYLRTVK